MNRSHATEQRRRAEELVSWTCGERIRFLWFRLCLTTQEMAYATGQMIEFQMGLTSPDADTRQAQLLRDGGSPNLGRTAGSKRVIAETWAPDRVRTISPTV